MAQIDFNIEYSQPVGSGAGVIIFNGQSKLSNGRLDFIGDLTSAEGFPIEVPNCSSASVTITCKRTSSNKMQVVVEIFASCLDDSSSGYGYGYGYGGEPIYVVKTIDDVELQL